MAEAKALVPAVMLGGDLPCKRILNGLWQTSGGWGPAVGNKQAVEAMYQQFTKGYTTFDGADHYGPAEDLMGLLRERLTAEEKPLLQAFTKWCPRAGSISRAMADSAVARSLSRMKVQRLDCLQLHWWEYSMRKELLTCIHHLDDIRKEGKINKIALTNFDTEHVELFIKEGIPIASNQVQFSLVDTRPLAKMVPVCAKHGVQLLTYGTLMGGLLTDNWLGKPAPKSKADLPTPSLGKYYRMVQQWGSWELFQELLRVLRAVADRHSASIANVAVKWVLDQPAVGGVIVGLRAGLSEHGDDNAKALAITLTQADMSDIQAVISRGENLLKSIGDCGDEYR